MKLVTPQPERFKDRFDIPVIVFGQIPVEDQARLVGVDDYLAGLRVRDWKKDSREYITPKRAYMTWMQSGSKNLKRSVERVRSTLCPDERGATVYDGIGLYIARPNILKDHIIDLPGTSVWHRRLTDYHVEHREIQAWSGWAPCLELSNDRPKLESFLPTDASPKSGSATCGRNKS